jgi:hypothetical protein
MMCTSTLSASQVQPHVCSQRHTTTATINIIFQKSYATKRMAWGPLSVPCRLGTPAYKPQVETRYRACIHTLPHVPQLRTPPPCKGGLRCCHASHNSRPRLPAQEGSSAATLPMALDPTSLLGGTPVLRCIPWLWTTHPCSGGL